MHDTTMCLYFLMVNTQFRPSPSRCKLGCQTSLRRQQEICHPVCQESSMSVRQCQHSQLAIPNQQCFKKEVAAQENDMHLKHLQSQVPMWNSALPSSPEVLVDLSAAEPRCRRMRTASPRTLTRRRSIWLSLIKIHSANCR